MAKIKKVDNLTMLHQNKFTGSAPSRLSKHNKAKGSRLHDPMGQDLQSSFQNNMVGSENSHLDFGHWEGQDEYTGQGGWSASMGGANDTGPLGNDNVSPNGGAGKPISSLSSTSSSASAVPVKKPSVTLPPPRKR